MERGSRLLGRDMNSCGSFDLVFDLQVLSGARDGVVDRLRRLIVFANAREAARCLYPRVACRMPRACGRCYLLARSTGADRPGQPRFDF